ncbi:MAG: hypothetical protein V6Z78_02545 [Holosporaceae bacterium]
MRYTITALILVSLGLMTSLSLNAALPADLLKQKSQAHDAAQTQCVKPQEMDLLKRKHDFLKQKNARLAQHLKRFQAKEIAVINALHQMTHTKGQGCPEDIRKLLQLILEKG